LRSGQPALRVFCGNEQGGAQHFEALLERGIALRCIGPLDQRQLRLVERLARQLGQRLRPRAGVGRQQPQA